MIGDAGEEVERDDRDGDELEAPVPGWTRGAARRLGLVTLKQMVAALADAVDHPAGGVRVVTVPEIKSGDFCRP